MKKIISTLLAVIMLTMCLGTTGFAAEPNDIEFTSETFENVIDLLDNHMPLTQQQRVEVFDILEFYIAHPDFDSIDSLILMLESDTITGGAEGEGTLNGIVSSLGSILTENKNTVLFVLDVLKALPLEKRQAAVVAFRDSQNKVEDASALANTWWVDEETAGVVIDSVDQDALKAVYDAFVNNDGEEPGHGQLGTHGIGPNTILQLSKAFKGELLLTDDAENSGDFAIKSVSDSFKTNLGTFVANHFATINGADITEGQVVLDAFVAALNSFEDELKDNIKTVLGADEIALYEPLASEDEGGSNTPGIGGWGSSSKPSTPNPADKIGEIQPVTTPVGAPGAAEAAYIYTDTEDHWAQDYIAELSKRGIFNGYEDGSFKPDLGITREEIAVAMTRALGLESKARYAPRYNFSDSSFISLWAADAVNMMVKEGVFTGYDDNEYKPKRVITREELVAVVMRIFDDNLLKAQLTYTDHHEIGDWSRAYVKKATELAIVGGYPDGTFRPTNPITRAEAAKILYTFMHYAGLL